MSFLRIGQAIPLILCFLSTWNLWAWGERGHHAVGYAAAYGVNHWVAASDKEKVGVAFDDRAHMMGHLNNVPDISWKGVKNSTVLKLNGPTHYFDPELLFPKMSFDEVTKKVSELPSEWTELQNQHKDPQNHYIGGKIDLYSDVGSAPYRIQDLYRKMVFFFECAKQKQDLEKQTLENGKKKAKWSDRELPFVMNGEIIVRSARCPKQVRPANALLAGFTAGGTLGHFVADLAQPYHTSIDFDGFATGQGGIHGYFETAMVRAMPQDLAARIASHLKDQKKRKEWMKLYGIDTASKSESRIIRTVLKLIQDSRNQHNPLRKLDEKHALLKKGEVLPFGAKASRGNKRATRKPAEDIAQIQEFIEFTADRLARGAFVLSYIWHQAWSEAGKPHIADVDKESTVYPLDVGFLKPEYAP